MRHAELHTRSRIPGPVASVTALPLTISGLALWIAADALNLSDGNAVSSWTDLSNNGNHPAQGTGSLQPIFKTNIVNGLPVVRFDGSDDSLYTPSNVVCRTSFIVAKYGASGNYPNYKAQFDTNTGGTYNIALYNNGTTSMYAGSDTYNNMRRNRTATNDSAPIDSFAQYTYYPGTTRTTIIRVGGTAADNSRCWNGDIAELLIYDTTLSASDRDAIEFYLIGKYGL